MAIVHQDNMPTPSELRCEYCVDPIGLDVIAPRFSWRIEATQNGAAQSGYRVLVATSLSVLAYDAGDLWDSGRIDSMESVGVVYAGKALESRQLCFWKVCVWDEAGLCAGFSPPANFEMALLRAEDWQAIWLGSPGGKLGGARYFRCAFKVSAPVAKARLYATGLGYYEILLNGRKQGAAVLDPAYTDVTKRIFYTTHDAGGVLCEGENVMSAVVCPGWHGVPMLLAQLEIELLDGRRQVVTTTRVKEAPIWTVASGPVISASVFDGETYDARREKTGWDLPGYDEKSVTERTELWTQAFALRSPGGRLQAQPLEPIEIMHEIVPVSVCAVKSEIFVFDFGQNHAGWTRLQVQGERGTAITLKYAEVLAQDGTVNQENLRTAQATDVYILRGGALESWSPRFTYHGYRYVQVEGWPGTPTTDSLISCVVRSALAVRGEFACSNALLNRIHAMVRWTEESNLHGIPTDCPQRNERMGWLNDLAARTEELVYNFETTRLLEKFATDIGDAQDSQTGALSDTVPFHWGRQPADPVSVSYLLIPWLLHTHSGSRRVLEQNFAGMQAWVDFLTSKADRGIVAYSYYGDWAPPVGEAVASSVGSGAISARTPGELISTAYYFYAVNLLGQIAGRLSRENEQRSCLALAEDIKVAFHRVFWNEERGGYGSSNQACNSIALYLGLVPAELRSRVVSSLAQDVARHDYHLTTGNLCTKYVLEVLSAEGHAEEAMRIATQVSYPSWGYMLAGGATTVWERWELMTGGGMNSHNHPMLGSVGAWLYRWIAGLALGEPRGENPVFIIRPPLLCDLTSARATLQTAWGEAAVGWKRSDRKLRVEVTVPWNCTASVRLPGGYSHEISSGRYVFVTAVNFPTPTP